MDKTVRKFPLVSVNMPVYNGEKYIAEAIQSILDQTYANFELIILDDGSTDKSLEIAFSFTDERIKIYTNETNTGLARVRNRLLTLSNGKYIAPLDCDDIAYPDRLQKQVAFMEANPEFGLLGAGYDIINQIGQSTGKVVTFDAPPEKIPIILTTQNYFAQSAVMMRKSMIPRKGYQEGFAPAEDYELWSRFNLHCKIWNLPEILLKYRWYAENTSNRCQNLIDLEKSIIKNQLIRFGLKPSENDLKIHDLIFRNNYVLSLEFINQAEKWLMKVSECIAENCNNEFSSQIEIRWKNLTYGSTRLGISFFYTFWRSPLSKWESLSLSFKLRFFVKCLFHI